MPRRGIQEVPENHSARSPEASNMPLTHDPSTGIVCTCLCVCAIVCIYACVRLLCTLFMYMMHACTHARVYACMSLRLNGCMHVRMRAYVLFDARVNAPLQRTLRLAKGPPHAAACGTERSLSSCTARRGAVQIGGCCGARAQRRAELPVGRDPRLRYFGLGCSAEGVRVFGFGCSGWGVRLRAFCLDARVLGLWGAG